MSGRCVKVDGLSEVVWTACLQNLISKCCDLVVDVEVDWKPSTPYGPMWIGTDR